MSVAGRLQNQREPLFLICVMNPVTLWKPRNALGVLEGDRVKPGASLAVAFLIRRDHAHLFSKTAR